MNLAVKEILVQSLHILKVSQFQTKKQHLGLQGPPGSQGSHGEKGECGSQGAAGKQGIQGLAGNPGETITSRY